MSKYSRLLPNSRETDAESEIVSDAALNKRDSAPVVLHIYDAVPHTAVQKVNGVLSSMGTGAYHAGVEVYGREWSFGSTEMGGSGVDCCVEPGQNDLYTYVKRVPLGYTSLSPFDVQVLLRRLSDEWQEEDYDLLRCNCCHFSAELCRQLGVEAVPNWVLNLAGAGAVLDDSIQTAKSLPAKASARARASREMTAAIAHIASRMAGTVRQVRACSRSRQGGYCSSNSYGRRFEGVRGTSWAKVA